MSEDKKATGRPFTYTPEEFQEKWDEYFNYIDNNPIYKYDVVKSGENAGTEIKIRLQRPYTEMGFQAYHNHGVHFITQLNTILSSITPPTENTAKEEVEKYKTAQALSSVLNRARAKCTANKFDGAAAGIFNANIIARDLGLVDKQALAGDENGGAIKIIVKSKSGDVKSE